jgi:hypothetical protein
MYLKCINNKKNCQAPIPVDAVEPKPFDVHAMSTDHAYSTLSSDDESRHADVAESARSATEAAANPTCSTNAEFQLKQIGGRATKLVKLILRDFFCKQQIFWGAAVAQR